MSDEAEVTSECDIDAPPGRVYEALTDPELVAEWLDDEVPGIGPVERTLVEATPEKVRYALHSDDGERAVDSEVTFTLTPTPAGGTRVRLVHDGFIVRESDLVAMRRAA
ncbi:MAG: SRPBCC domain-containing protein [Myxococcota bacterium]